MIFSSSLVSASFQLRLKMFIDNFLTVVVLACSLLALPANAQKAMVLDREGSTIAIEAYAPNIVRITLSLQKDQAIAPPGFGFVGSQSVEGWSQQHSDSADIYRSSRIAVTVDTNRPGPPPPTNDS